MTNIYAALEIGTTRTVLAVGEAETGGRLKIVRHAEIPSSGVKKSQILDITLATQSIRSVLRDVEKKTPSDDSIDIGNAFLVVSGSHVKADSYQGTAQVGGSKVTQDDIDEVISSSRLMSLPKDREMLDIIDQSYILDGLGGIASPKGMSGRVLKLDTLQIHADKNRIDNARTAAAGAHLELRDALFAVTCAADAVLTGADRRNGALVLDLGGGSTGWAVYIDGYPVLANSIAVGGDHVTNDIAYAFQTTQSQAETLKCTEACAIVGADKSASPRVKLTGFSPLMESRNLSRRALDTVVNLRLKELLSVIRDDLEDHDLLHRLNAGTVLTGGGAAQRGMGELVKRELGIPARIGIPTEIGGLDNTPASASFAAISGALIYAHRNYERKPFLHDIFGRIFK